MPILFVYRKWHLFGMKGKHYVETKNAKDGTIVDSRWHDLEQHNQLVAQSGHFYPANY